MKVEENREYRLQQVAEVVGESSYIDSREVFCLFFFETMIVSDFFVYQVILRVTLKAGRYVVIPTTFEPRREAKFMIRFFTETFANARFIKHDEPVHRFYHSLCVKCGNIHIHTPTKRDRHSDRNLNLSLPSGILWQ